MKSHITRERHAPRHTHLRLLLEIGAGKVFALVLAQLVPGIAELACNKVNTGMKA